MPHDHEDLAQRVAAGDAAAAGELMRHHLPGLRAFVRLRSGEEIRAQESASDLVQSACLEVLRNMDRFRFPSEAAFKHWLYSTAIRKIGRRVEFYRAERRDVRRHVAPPREDLDDDRLLACYRSFATPSGHAMVQEEIARIESALELLPEDYREVITLAHVVGYSRAEIAEQMGKSEGAVRILLHRALARVSALLAEPESRG